MEAGRLFVAGLPQQVVPFTLHGQKGGFVTIVPPDEWPDYLQRAWQDRKQASTTGSCPCGASIVLPMPQRGLRAASMEHEDDCLVPDDAFLYAVGRWAQRRDAP